MSFQYFAVVLEIQLEISPLLLLQPTNRRICEPLHTDLKRAARYFLYMARPPRQEKARAMDTKTSGQILFLVAIATMITIAAFIGIAPTLWASF